MLEINKIHNMDCVDGIGEIPDKSVDLIIFDPPYSKYSGSDGESVNLGHYKILEVYFKELSNHFKRILKGGGSLFGFCDFRTYPSLYYGMFYNFKPTNLIIWKKDFIGPGTGFRPLHELIVWWRNNEKTVPKDRSTSDIWQAKREKDGLHPHQKPLELIERMILNCSSEGDLILDPFGGAGTVAVACKNLKRNCITFEIDSRNCQIAEDRLKKMPKSLDNFIIENTASKGDV